MSCRLENWSFFFQEEDGIRYGRVTGVQTCALPISVSGGRIYIGVSSHCDNPLVRGGVIGYAQATGKIFARYYDVPKGVVGGSVWSSVAANGRHVYVSTGNGVTGARRLHDMFSIVELRAGT